jgi:hypothetical protein
MGGNAREWRQGKGRLEKEGWQCKGMQPREGRQGQDGKAMEAQSKGRAFMEESREEEVQQGKSRTARQGKGMRRQGKIRAARQGKHKAREVRSGKNVRQGEVWQGKESLFTEGKTNNVTQQGKGSSARQGEGCK